MIKMFLTKVELLTRGVWLKVSVVRMERPSAESRNKSSVSAKEEKDFYSSVCVVCSHTCILYAVIYASGPEETNEPFDSSIVKLSPAQIGSGSRRIKKEEAKK